MNLCLNEPLIHARACKGKCRGLLFDGEPTEINSYHNFGAMGSRPPLDVWASAEDGVVKAIRHSNDRVIGIMWHPERFDPFRSDDIGLVRRIFGVN